MADLSDQTVKDLNKLISKMSQNLRGGGTGGGSRYGATRFTTPDVGGFRAFFNAAIGDPIIEAIAEGGISGAIEAGIEKITGSQRRIDISETFDKILNAVMDSDRYQAATPTEQEQMRQEVARREMNMQTAETVKNLRTMVGAIAATTFALFKFREAVIETGQQLGGVSLDQALSQIVQTTLTSIGSLFSGEYVRGAQLRQLQGGVANEFGRLINSEEALRLGRVQQRLGISTQELVKLERALQGTGIEAEDAVNQFRDVGIVGRVAATEIAKNADAVARAGDEFNRFIVQGVENARRLGLEFGQIEQTLTGISTDFTGTVGNFSELRAAIPGFATDFGQLFTTALYGTTDEFVEQIRGDLQGAGISDVSQLNRTQLALLEQATGFGAAELQRILDNEEVFQDEALDLDTKRNQMLNKMNLILFGGIGAIIGAIVGSSVLNLIPGLGVATGLAGALGGAAIGGALGLGAGVASSALFNDFVFRPGQPPARFSPSDTIVGVKNPEELRGKPADMRGLENKVDQLIIAMDRQTTMMNRGMSVEMKGIDKAILRGKDAAIRNQ